MNSLIISIGTIGTLFSCVYLGYIALDKFSIKLPNTIKGLFTVIALISLVIHTFFYMDWGSNLDNFQWWIEKQSYSSSFRLA